MTIADLKRSVLNMNFVGGYEYAFIDHVKQGDQFGQVGTQWASGTPFNTVLDASGYVNVSGLVSPTRKYGLGLFLPDSSNFAGPYVLTWQGDGIVQLLAGTWTVNAGLSSNYTQTGNGNYNGTNSYIVLTYSGTRATVGLAVTGTDRSANGQYLKGLKFYRLEDEADLNAGKVFRRGFKQPLIALNPAAIRFMNWNGYLSLAGRWENRTQPKYVVYNGTSNFVASLPYGAATGTNQYVLASVTGTPGSMTHGELVTARITNAAVRAGSRTVTAITKANPGVAASTAHGYSNGDVIVHIISAGMTQLNAMPVTVTVVDVDHYSIGVDTSAFTTFTVGTSEQYITLNVGARGDFPVVFPDGATLATHFGPGYIAAGDYKTFTFDKTLVASTLVNGVWIFNDTGSNNGLDSGVPAEICTALINELNAETTAGPIHMWISLPYLSMMSVDNDYSAGSNLPVNMVATILNGANGFAGLNSRASLFVEFCNETWNSGGGFKGSFYLARRGFLRYGGGTADFSTFTTLRAVVAFEDIKAAFPGNSRIKYVMAGQGTVGVSATNSIRISGNTNYNNDVWNVWGTPPSSHFDYFAWAGYFDASSTFDTANLTTLAAQYIAATTDADRETACAAYVVGVVGTGSGETTSRYGGTLLPAYASAMVALGKGTIMYEGGWDHSVTSGTTDQNTFLVAVKRSAAWAKAQADFFNLFPSTSGAFMPSVYVEINDRWGYASPDSYSGGVEGAALSETWSRMSVYNAGRQRFLLNF